jgi:hypothetical protein
MSQKLVVSLAGRGVKKKSTQEREQELAELCRKNGVNKLSNREWFGAASSDPPLFPQVPPRVRLVTQSNLKQALSPQKKPEGGLSGRS